jgi:hypothetical protein
VKRYQLILLSVLTIFAIIGGWLYYGSKGTSNDKIKFAFLLCPEIDVYLNISPETNLRDSSLDCECAYNTVKSQMPADRFVEMLNSAELRMKSAYRNGESFSDETKMSAREAVKVVERSCLEKL